MSGERDPITQLMTQMDYVVKSIDEIKTYYVHKTQFEALQDRVSKLEKVVFWASTTIIGALVIGAIALIFDNYK